jgi:hypothetical protein
MTAQNEVTKVVATADAAIIPKLIKTEHVICNTNSYNKEKDEPTPAMQHQGFCEGTRFTECESTAAEVSL